MNSFAISATSLPAIVISSGMRPFVRRAAEDVAGDIGKIVGARPAIVEGPAPASNAIVLRKAGEGWENYAVEAKDADDWPCALRHAKAAIALGHERDALDARYNSGKWTHWYDRDLKYPCRSVMESLERELAHLC